MFSSLQPHGLKPTRLLYPWNSPGKNNGVGSHSLFQGIFPIQGIFPTQGSNPGLPHGRQILYRLSYQGSPPIQNKKFKKKKRTIKKKSAAPHILARMMGGWSQWLKKKKIHQVRRRFPDGLTASPRGPRGPLLSILVSLNWDPEGNRHKAQLEGKTAHNRSALPVSYSSRDRQPFWTLFC